MDILDMLGIIERDTYEDIFKSNVYTLCFNNPETDKEVMFIYIESYRDLEVIKEKLLTNKYVSNFDNKFIDKHKEEVYYPMYMRIESRIRITDKKNPLGLNVILYDQEFIDIYSSSYDIKLITIKELIDTWI